jgi:hypothetical protein
MTVGPPIPGVCGQSPGKLKPALTPEHDVHQDNLRPELLCPPQRLSRGSGNADDAQALLFQAIAGGLQKQPVVVHNQDTERRHVNSVPAWRCRALGLAGIGRVVLWPQIRRRGRISLRPARSCRCGQLAALFARRARGTMMSS